LISLYSLKEDLKGRINCLNCNNRIEDPKIQKSFGNQGTTVEATVARKSNQGAIRKRVVIVFGVLFWLLFWTSKKVTNNPYLNTIPGF